MDTGFRQYDGSFLTTLHIQEEETFLIASTDSFINWRLDQIKKYPDFLSGLRVAPKFQTIRSLFEDLEP